MGDKVSVASTVYNLAGDEEHRLDYLKMLVLGGVLQSAKSLGSVVANGYANGPGTRFKRFLRWAKADPEFQAKLGTTEGELKGARPIDLEVVKANIPVGPGEYVDSVQSARIESADVAYWVLRYLAEAYPEDAAKGLAGSHTYTFDRATGEVVVTFSDASTESFTVAGFTEGAEYLYARYVPALAEAVDPPTWGAQTTLPDGDPFPSLDGYHEDESLRVDTEFTANLNYRHRTVITYSDGRPKEEYETVTSQSASIDQSLRAYFKDAFKGKGPGSANSVYSERSWVETDLTYAVGDYEQHDNVLTGVETIAGGVTKTTKTFREHQVFKPVRRVRYGTGNVVHKAWNAPQYFIYQHGSGDPELDALFAAASVNSLGAFFPPIPFRHDNKPVGPHGTGATEWSVDLSAAHPHFVPPDPYIEVYVKGGPVGDHEQIQCVVFANPSDSVVHIRPRADGAPISLALGSRGAQYRTVIFSPYTVDQDPQATEHSGWSAFPVPPEPLNSEALTDLYPICKKAFKKAFGTAFDDIQDQILDNESVKDIDHAYAVFGVSLNVEEEASRKYAYLFFQHLMQTAPGYSAQEVTDWFADWQAAHASQVAYQAWVDTVQAGATPEYAEPQRIPYPVVPWQTLNVQAVREGSSDYRVAMRWAFISEEVGTGLLKPGAKPDELWFEQMPDPLSAYPEHDAENPDFFNQQVRLNWQDGANTWRRLTVTGLQHRNYVYADRAISTTAKQALDPAATGESPFIVPMHEAIFARMSVVDATQMATACAFLVFNSYAVDKEEWYETWWFKAIVIVVVIAISIVLAIATGGTSLGAGGAVVVGLLTGAGLSVTASLILAAVVNVLVGLLISWIISKASVVVFGEKWGPLIGAIISTVVTLGLSTGSVAEAVNALSRPETWIAIGLATGNGVAGVLQAQALQVQEDTAKMLEDYSAQAAEVQRKYNETFASGGIDPAMIRRYIWDTTERPEHFLQRTLMTGFDIAEVTLGSIENFAKDQLRLALP